MTRHWRCQQLLVEFFHHLDGKTYGRLVDLFDQDAVWQRPTALLRGRTEIEAALVKRSATALTRHLTSNLIVLADRGDEIDVALSLTTYAFDTQERRDLPVEVAGPIGIFRAMATIRIQAERTQLLRLDLRPEFMIRGSA